MKLWITDEPFPTSSEVVAAALAAGAEQVVHGVPPAFADRVAPGTTGYVELDDPPAPPAEPDAPTAAEQALAVFSELSAPQLVRLTRLGVHVTDPAAVEALTAAVEADDPTAGVAIVAAAAADALLASQDT